MRVVIGVFIKAFLRLFKGGVVYYAWVLLLVLLVGAGLNAYMEQYDQGLIVTAMRDQVSWGLYIGNFTFLVGVAAAAVLLVIPAYLYHFKPIKEIVLFGEMIAITAIIMCLLFITVDMGQPLRAWHALPFIGEINFPSSVLAWDIIVLNGYLALNAALVLYALYTLSTGREYRLVLIMPIIILSIPWAVSIHTVTAFIYSGLPSRPFWNASILAPRFLASAFSAGPALIIIVLQLIRKFSKVEIENRAIHKIAELMAYALFINLFFLGSEVFKEFYSNTVHKAPLEYLYFGLHGHKGPLTPLIWLALIFNITAMIILLFPKLRENVVTLNLSCLLIFTGVYIEKGLGLIIPGFIPGALGEIYEYWPTRLEGTVTLGIWAIGALTYTLMVKFAIPIYTGELRVADPEKER